MLTGAGGPRGHRVDARQRLEVFFVVVAPNRVRRDSFADLASHDLVGG